MNFLDIHSMSQAGDRYAATGARRLASKLNEDKLKFFG
jgi:hypothetical protein